METAFESDGVFGTLHRPDNPTGDALILTHGAGSNAHAPLLLGVAPVEVYGSSETGGVAWRQRARHGDTWQPLPGIAQRFFRLHQSL